MAISYKLSELANATDTEFVGDGAVVIRGVGSLAQAQPGEISHLSQSRYLDQVAGCQASALILRSQDQPNWSGPALLASNPYLTYARITQLFAPPLAVQPGIHAHAVVDPTARVDPSASLAPGVVVGAATEIAAGAILMANVVVGANCRLGSEVRLMPNVTLYDRVRLGARCVVHSQAVLGADGFGYTPDAAGRLVEIAQLGGVQIGDDVSIGANTTIDRGALDDTCIEEGVKIDNQVQIGHNCHIGAHSLICGCVGVVGSTRIGRHCVLAGGSGIGGDGPISLCDGVVVSGMTHISQSITEPGVYSGGILASRSAQWKRNAIRFTQLDELSKRVRKLERD